MGSVLLSGGEVVGSISDIVSYNNNGITFLKQETVVIWLWYTHQIF